MNPIGWALVWIAISLKGFLMSLNRLWHPDDFRERWRWITWGDTLGRYRSSGSLGALAIRIEVVVWGLFLAGGTIFAAAKLVA